MIGREDSAVPTLLISEARGFTVFMRYKHLTIVSIQSGSLIIDIACNLVIAIVGRDVEGAVAHGAQQFTIHIIKVKVHEAVALAGQQDGVCSHFDAFKHLFLHIFVCLIADEQRSHCRARIDRIDAQVVLMTIEGVNQQSRSIVRGLDTRNVSIGI